MRTFTRFEEIEAWQEARLLTSMIYAVTREMPFRRDYSLCDQIRRSAISTMSNIAEGYERHRRKAFIHFLAIAKASGSELKSQLYVALDAGYITAGEFEELWAQADKVTRMIYGLIRYLQQAPDHRPPPPKAGY